MPTLAQYIARNIAIIKNVRSNSTHVECANQALNYVEREILPRGSGIDKVVSIDRDKSSENKIVTIVDYHHMDNEGYYCGWRQYTVTVSACLAWGGIDVKVTGNEGRYFGTKDYLAELFLQVMQREI